MTEEADWTTVRLTVISAASAAGAVVIRQAARKQQVRDSAVGST